MPNEVFVSGAVEGPSDDAVARRLLSYAGANAADFHVKGGRTRVLAKINGYNHAAQYAPWMVLVDLDNDPCVCTFVRTHLPKPAKLMCFRVAVKETEAWLLADRQRIAQFLGVSAGRIPLNPDSVPNPKRSMVELAKLSRKYDIRKDMVPRPESGREVGPAYTSRLIEFAHRHWRPEVALHSSDSLNRCVLALRRLVESMRAPRLRAR